MNTQIEEFDNIEMSVLTSTYVAFKFGCKFRSFGSFRSIRFVELVSKKSISVFVEDIVWPKINFPLKHRKESAN